MIINLLRILKIDQAVAWLNIRLNYGKRCDTKDTEDFSDQDKIKPHCNTCSCARCGVCVAWEEYDEIF